jgi:predicted Ser/Thr protein kinase
MQPNLDPNINQSLLGRYRVVKLLGQGAFGKVYLAEHAALSVRVVIKVAHDSSSGEDRSAFLRETRALASVESPHLVRLFDSGTTEDGRAFLVREYVEGTSLDELIEISGHLELTVALEVGIAIARGLAALHGANILHRDIKPSNIIVPFHPEQAKLLDFGIVGRLQQDTNTTLAGELFGTPLYAAPEQLLAEAQSPAADIYSLAATLYQMIFGVVPFGGPSLHDIFQDKLAGNVRFPKDKRVPAALVSWIRRSLSPEAKDRPQDAADVISQLKKILEAVGSDTDMLISGEAGRTTRLPPELSSARANKVVNLAVLIGFLIALTMLVWSSWGRRYHLSGILLGICYATIGMILARWLRRWIKSRRTEIEIESGNLLLTSKAQINLGESLAIEVDKLITRVRRWDDKILATSLAIMVNEFQVAPEGQTRQAAIMNVVQLLEKLTARLSPWYVRYEKLLTIMVSAIGVISGITTVTASIIKIAKGK